MSQEHAHNSRNSKYVRIVLFRNFSFRTLSHALCFGTGWDSKFPKYFEVKPRRRSRKLTSAEKDAQDQHRLFVFKKFGVTKYQNLNSPNWRANLFFAIVAFLFAAGDADKIILCFAQNIFRSSHVHKTVQFKSYPLVCLSFILVFGFN